MGLLENTKPPLTVHQVMAALVAVGAAPVADPDLRPDGPTADDLPEMLGALAAVIELEMASTVNVTAVSAPSAAVELARAWMNQVGDDRVPAGALIHRLVRTGYDMAVIFTTPTAAGSDHQDDEPGAVAAAGAACHLAAGFLQAHLHEADPPTAIQMLDLAEGYLAASLAALYGMRLRYAGRSDDPAG